MTRTLHDARASDGMETRTSGRLACYWAEDVPDFRPTHRPLRSGYDVIVVGGGFSGLAVAWGLARGGCSVLLLEEREIGFGASSRNGGMVGPSFHELGMIGLTSKYGEERTRRIMRAGMDALDYCQDLFRSEGIDCDFQLTGRFRGARSHRHLESMVAECSRLHKAVGLSYEVVARSRVPRHTGARSYLGGVVYPRDGGVHPKRLVNSLARLAEREGAHLSTHTPARGLCRDGNSFRVSIGEAELTAQQVVIATNGYSDHRTPAMNSRVVPIDVSVAATRMLGEDRVRSMSPCFHMHGESGRVFIWSRPSPDHERFIFGGRISDVDAPLEVQRRQIASAVQRLYPELAASDFEFVWNGRIAYTADHAPHLARVDGVWLIGGYCGSGVTRSLFFADKLVRKITGQPEADTPFDDLPFPKVPFRPLAPRVARVMTRYYKWLDRRDATAGDR